jgi:guanosine-3',5'-bis(diphosphate) 3'-pyrophosphohydrolase
MPDGYGRLIERIRQYDSGCDLSLLEKAYNYSKKAHAEQTRFSGDPFIVHPMEVAYILADLELDCASVIAAILHDTVKIRV